MGLLVKNELDGMWK